MRIAQVAPLYESVPPRLYGGTERVVSWLTEELVRRGHDVTLFASRDSRTMARLVAPCERAVRLDPSRPDAITLHMLEISDVLAQAEGFDVLHCHLESLALPLGTLARCPTVHTLHGRIDVHHMVRLLGHYRHVPLVSISDAQRRPVADLDLNWQATVHHGLPLEMVPFDPDGGRGGYLAFLGRVSPEKRPDLAIAVAKQLERPLVMAGKIDHADRSYFESEIRPLLDHPLIEFIGELGQAQTFQFLSDALCLLFPIDWPEPFGLVMIEAMACGTPVIARPCGSVPEVICDGVTGYIADTVDEMVGAVKRLDLIERSACRAHVERRFSVGAMADRYEEVYERLITIR